MDGQKLQYHIRLNFGTASINLTLHTNVKFFIYGQIFTKTRNNLNVSNICVLSRHNCLHLKELAKTPVTYKYAFLSASVI